MKRKTGIVIALILVSITASSILGFMYLSRSRAYQEEGQWRFWAEIAWRYYAPGIGVDKGTLLHRANI